MLIMRQTKQYETSALLLLPLYRSAQTAFVSYFVWIDKFSLSLRRKRTQTPANMAIDILIVDIFDHGKSNRIVR